MEGVGDRCFRKAIASIGGFDEAVAEFLRVPANAHIKSLAKQYDAQETTPFPLAAQIMGSNPELMGLMAQELEANGAPRIDLNCGCPSNTVTGRGAGSSLLKTPDLLNEIAKEIVRSVSIPVTIKMRSGYEDLSLFRENLLAAEESGVQFITLHPRTKVDGYGPPAKWDLIAEAKSILKIPVVGNGDILNAEDAVRMMKQTGCDALMVGRGAVINPFIFHEIKCHFSGMPFNREWHKLVNFFTIFQKELSPESPDRAKINKLKQLMGFLFKGNDFLLERRQEVLRYSEGTMEEFLNFSLPLLNAGF